MQSRKRYVLVGVGGRGEWYVQTLVKNMATCAQLVGLCDINPGRLEACQRRIINEWGGSAVPLYRDTQFDRMIREQKPDVVVVTTKDCVHDRYIIRALELGCDAITEKPMTMEAGKCQRILDAVKRTGRRVRVTFNYRYSPPRTQIKDLLMKGAVGNILSVEFQWLLNTRHGADYFRRWHREKKNSGGLLVHKATHHFDLVNWWLAAWPVEVFAMGARRYYGPAGGMVERLGLQGHAQRCTGCACRKRCPFYLDLDRTGHLKNLYRDCERYDGYFRDRCVFGASMDIEDTMNLVVRYNTGALMSYALNAFMPWEGYHVAFNGTRGRLEHDCVESVYISGDGSVQGATIPHGTKIRLYPHFKPARDIPVHTAKGGHGGGDSLIMNDLFKPHPPRDPYRRAADHVQGAWSILTGIAANRSMRAGRPIKTTALVRGLPKPDYAPMKVW